MAGHESPRTTKLYDRTKDEITTMEHSRNAGRRHVAYCILQFIMSTLQVAAFAIAAPVDKTTRPLS
jgi:hypothetical protein